jgi:hypothetical protein
LEREVYARHLDGEGFRRIGRDLGESSRQVEKLVRFLDIYFADWSKR